MYCVVLGVTTVVNRNGERTRLVQSQKEKTHDQFRRDSEKGFS
jgi:hypothetical protein